MHPTQKQATDLGDILISMGYKTQKDDAAGLIINLGETENGTIYYLYYYGRLDIGYSGGLIFWVSSLFELNEVLSQNGHSSLVAPPGM